MRRWVDALVFQGVSAEYARHVVSNIIDDCLPQTRGTRPVPDAIKAQAAPIQRQYVELYVARYGERPSIFGQELINLHKLLKEHGAELVSRRLNAFYDWDDPWFRDHARTLGLF